MATSYDHKVNGRRVITYPDSREGQIAAFRYIREVLIREAYTISKPKDGESSRPFVTADIVRYGMLERLISSIDTGVLLHENGFFRQIPIHARVAIDAIARYNGMFHASNPDDYIGALLGRGSIRVCRSIDGIPMRDDFLQRKLGEKCPYSFSLYQGLCEEIHLGKTMTGRIFTRDPERISKELQKVEIKIGSTKIDWCKYAKDISHTLIMAVLAYRYTGPSSVVIDESITDVGIVKVHPK